MSAGTYANPDYVIGFIDSFAASAVTAAQYLRLWGPSPCHCQITGIQADARTAGSGVGSTVLDVLVNGTSIWTTTSLRPTLATASTGAFTLSRPYASAIRPGDRIDIQVVTIPASTGHALVRCTVTLERTH